MDDSKMILMCVVAMCAALAIGFCAEEQDPREAPPKKTAGQEVTRQQRAVEALGFTDFNEEGAAIFGCGEDDSVLASVNFTATDLRGQKIEGSVCCGLVFKSCTVRF